MKPCLGSRDVAAKAAVVADISECAAFKQCMSVCLLDSEKKLQWRK